MKRRTFVMGMLAGAISTVSAVSWAQQTYPSRPVRIVVAIAAGGSIDLVARLVGQRLSDALGQTFLVDNRPGGSGIIGTDLVAKATPNGYTLVMAPSVHLSLHPSLFAKLPYDPVRDFAPVINVAIQPSVLVVHPSSPHRTVKELVAFVSENSGKLNYGGASEGSPHHLSGVMLSSATKTKMVYVPYKGGALAVADLLAARVDLIFAPVPEVLHHIRGGKLRALAVMSHKRASVLPNVSTMQETGFSGLELDTWIGLVAPAGTPSDIVARLNNEVQKALRGDLRERFAEVGLDIAGGTPDQFAATIRDDIAVYARLVNVSGMAIQ